MAESKKSNFIAVKFCDFTLKVKNVREVYGHDDSYPYNAEFEVTKNGEPFISGRAWNDGWGGTTNIALDDNGTMRGEKFNAVNDACAAFNYYCERYHFNAKHDLSDIIDTMAICYGDKNNGKTFSTTAVIKFMNSI